MAEEGEGGEGEGDSRMKMLEIYTLKTLKQVWACIYSPYSAQDCTCK